MAGRPCILFSLVLLAVLVGPSDAASCCLMYSSRPLGCGRVIGYTIQDINTSCDINAVILHLPNRFVCADPAAAWTQRAMACVDKRRRVRNFPRPTQAPASSSSLLA